MKRKYILCLVCLLASMAWARDGESVTLRLVQTSDVHGNYYPYDFIGRQQTLTPRSLDQWRFVPEDWAASAARRDYERLFGGGK